MNYLLVTALIFLASATVTHLTDENFEHLTQVTTGQSTGDWYILAIDDEQKSTQMRMIWDELSEIEQQETKPVNVAVLHVSHEASAKRLKLKHVPQTLYITKGRAYNITNVDSAKDAREKLANIKNFSSRKVPEIPSWMKNMLRAFSGFVMNNVKHNPIIFVASCVGIVILSIVGIVVCASALEKKDKKE